MTSVRPSLSFMLEYNELSDEDPRKSEIRELAFKLTEPGIILEGARLVDWPWGPTGSVPGFAVDVASGTGFVALAYLTDPNTGEDFVGLLHLIWPTQR